MPSTRRAQCAEDCRCVLCRELKGCKMSANGVQVQQQIGHEGANFILRRAMPFLLPKPPPREEWREVARHDDYEKSSTLEDRSRRGGVNDSRDLKPWTPSNDIGKTGKDVGHKTVIYFGDSNPRPKEDKVRQQQSLAPPPPPPPPPPPLPEACVQVTSRCNEDPEIEARPRDAPEREEDAGDAGQRRDAAMENGDPKAAHEIVVNVSPSREDVLRIEEDESQLEDYWSLPGDTSGFKADWSFVQQWRLRG